MSDENKEKKLSEDVEEETVKKAESNLGDDWTWDAVVPETETDNITFADLSVSIDSEEEKAEEKAEKEPEKETEEKSKKEESSDKKKEKEPEDKDEEKTLTPDDDGCCIVCGKKRGDSPSDLYCEDCREKFLRTDYGVGHILLAFVMVFAAVAGYFICASSLPFVPKFFDAKKMVEQGNYEKAMALCSEIEDDVQTVNTGINAIFKSANETFIDREWLNAGDNVKYLNLHSYANIAEIADSDYISTVELSFKDKDGKFDRSVLEGKKYDKIRKVYDFNKEILTVGNQYAEGLEQYYSYNEETTETTIDYDKAMKYINGIKAESQAELCMKEYFSAIVASYAQKDNSVVFEHLDKVMKEAGEFDYMFLRMYISTASEEKAYDKVIEAAQKGIDRNPTDTFSYYYLIHATMGKNDLKSADSYCEELKKNVPDSLDYYSLKAEILRRQKKFGDAVTLCTEGIAKGENAEIYRQQAIAYMLLDNKESAAEAANQAYEIVLRNAGYSEEMVDPIVSLETVALITFICGGEQDATYNDIVSLFAQEGVALNENVQLCIEGEIEFSDIFMKGDFDLS